MRALFASSEVYPLAKTGGLADVSGALPAVLANLGVDMRLVMPGYTAALDAAEKKGKPIPIGDMLGTGDVRLVPARTPDTGLPLWLVDCPALYRRRGGLYGDADGRDWPDNALRFALFSHAVARLALGAAGNRWQPDLVHVNDWQLGLVPALLRSRPGVRTPCVLTIHNLAFQGVFPREIFGWLGLPEDRFTIAGAEFHGKVSFLKAGLVFADRLTTVSPRYAREIQTPQLGCGLDGLLRARAKDLVGILNGIDYVDWDSKDPMQLPFPYSARNLSGKHRCKAALQQELGLVADPGTPLIAFVGRLTEQKMADALPRIAAGMADRRAQLAILGEGDRSIEQALRTLDGRHAGHVAVRIGYEESFARRVLAGADIVAVPSRFEPCGLVQMYGMRYGTIPVVRCVGGLADTVIGREDDATASHCQATGFLFEEPTDAGLGNAIDRACRLYREPVAWRAMQIRAMKQDFRWQRSAKRYLDLYRTLSTDQEKSAAGLRECMRRRPTGLSPQSSTAQLEGEMSNTNTAEKDKISEFAYAIWEREGKPEGRDLDHWLAAERELQKRVSSEASVTVESAGAGAPAPKRAVATGSRRPKSKVG